MNLNIQQNGLIFSHKNFNYMKQKVTEKLLTAIISFSYTDKRGKVFSSGKWPTLQKTVEFSMIFFNLLIESPI